MNEWNTRKAVNIVYKITAGKIILHYFVKLAAVFPILYFCVNRPG